MATAAVIRAHDCLGERGTNPRANNRRRKRSPTLKGTGTGMGAGGVMMGQVKILKRGEEEEEEVKPKMFQRGDWDTTILLKGGVGVHPDLSSTGRLGPDPRVLQKHIRVPDLYAGPTSIVAAPPPSSLPFPAALVRRTRMETALRKLLRI